MGRSAKSSEFLQALRQEFLPSLQNSSVPESLPELLARLASCLTAVGAVLWRAQEDQLVAQATFGSIRRSWAAAHATHSAGATALQSGASTLAKAGHGPYQSEVSGQPLAQVAAIPIRGPKSCVGSVELWWANNGQEPAPITELFEDLEGMLRQALPALLLQETDRHNFVKAISRLMMLYDVGKVFHSTLDLKELAPLIMTRVQNIVEAENVAVWLLDPVKKNLWCAAAAGPNRAVVESVRVWASDPGLGSAVSQNEAVLLHDVEDAAWTERWGSPIRSVLAIPLMHAGRFLGAIEVVRGTGSPYFTKEDLRLLVDVGKQAAVALRNAQRLEAERRVKELHALTEISKEITGTLDLDKVLSSAVNRIMTVIPADRCSVSLARKGKWELQAVSGEMKVDRKTPAMQELESIHTWLTGMGGDLSVMQNEQGVEADREETREKFAGNFERSGMRALLGLQLRDEEGVVGVLVLESKDPQALTPSHNDLARIFASQVTVAVRNALLYQQLPLIGVLQPFVEKKARFAAIPAVRRRALVICGAAAMVFMIFFPWWSKPSGDARVLPARIEPVSAEVEGVVRRVVVGEGENVAAGQVLAELDTGELRVALAQAQAQHDILARRVLQLESEGNLGAARIERARFDQAKAQLELQSVRFAQTQIRTDLSGLVITPRLEERVGQYMHRGDVFAQVVDLNRAWVEVSVPELDVGDIRVSQKAWVKLNTFPERRFDGHVIRVSPQGREEEKERVFDVIVEVPNPDGVLRAGMMGKGKVLARRASVGYLLLRVPARWIWLKVWNWLP